MAFLSNIFKQKPGGTMLGNLIRATASKATNGVLGNGAGVISQEDFDKKTLSDVEFYNRYAKTKNGVVLDAYKNSAANQPPLPTPGDPLLSTKMGVVKVWLKKYWYVPLLAVSALTTLLYFAFKKHTPKKTYRK